MSRKPSTAKKADSAAAKQNKARKPKAKTKAASEGLSTTIVSEEPRGRGRPSEFKPEYVEQARKLAEAGFTDQQMADWFECDKTTFYRWCARHEEFRHSIKIAKDGADDRVERSLYHKACGYTFDSEKIFNHQGEIVRAKCVEHVPPDTTAAIFWLKNRRGWKDKSEVDHGVTDALAALLGQIDGDGASLF